MGHCKAKILICDDKPQLVRLLQMHLEQRDYKVLPCYNGQEALRFIQGERPDLIVMDVDMPVMNGFQALQAIKENPATRKIPVVMLTARSDDYHVMRGWSEGADNYITKPFHPDRLLQEIGRILGFQETVGTIHSDGQNIFDL